MAYGLSSVPSFSNAYSGIQQAGEAIGEGIKQGGINKKKAKGLRSVLGEYMPDRKDEFEAMGLSDLEAETAAYSAKAQGDSSKFNSTILELAQSERDGNKLFAQGIDVEQTGDWQDMAQALEFNKMELEGYQQMSGRLQKEKGDGEGQPDARDAATGLTLKDLGEYSGKVESNISQIETRMADYREKYAEQREVDRSYHENRPLNLSGILMEAQARHPLASADAVSGGLKLAGMLQQQQEAERSLGTREKLQAAAVAKAEREGSPEVIDLQKRMDEARLNAAEMSTEASKAQRDKFNAEIAAMPDTRRMEFYKAETSRMQAEANRKVAETNSLRADLERRGGIKPEQLIKSYGEILDALGEQIRDIEHYQDREVKGKPAWNRLEASRKALDGRRKVITTDMEKLANQSKIENSTRSVPDNWRTVEGFGAGALFEVNGVKYRISADGKTATVEP